MSESAIQNDNSTAPATSHGKKPKSATPAAAQKVKKATVPKPAMAAKPKREKSPKEDLMVFAFRMTKAESVALHRAAGPANASRAMRALAGAFAREDRVAFEAIVEDARKLRA
jgi:hypothetical protein